MKYTKEQRLDIGRRIYDGEIDCYQAAEEYSINHYTARDYMRLYRDTYQLPNDQQQLILVNLSQLLWLQIAKQVFKSIRK